MQERILRTGNEPSEERHSHTYLSADFHVVSVYVEERPWCSEHGLMAQGSGYWYCEDCEQAHKAK